MKILSEKLFDQMLIYTTPEYLIVEENGGRLHFSRSDGSVSQPEESLTGDSKKQVEKLKKNKVSVLDEEIAVAGEVEFLVGLLTIEDNIYLFFVTDSSVVAHYRGTSENVSSLKNWKFGQKCVQTRHEIRKIERVIAVNVKSDLATIRMRIQPPTTKLKQGTEKLMKFFTDKINKGLTFRKISFYFNVISSEPRPGLLEDVLKLFNDSKDFYFCRDRDLTISSQKFFTKRSTKSEDSFFWNKNMLAPLNEFKSELFKWTCPIMQGFVATSQLEITDQINAFLNITIISRRSTQRAGARYLRRGIDENANVANFVETELILNIYEHELSFVQCRGSIPVFWSQRGYKYRPPLIINRSIEETHPVFTEHIRRLKEHYGTPLVGVSLVDQRGRELPLAQRFLEHCIKLDDSDFTFISFDLHHHCRGLNFQNLQILISKMEDILKTIGFCWVDKTGEVVQRQKGVVRTNCIDCLDRTNLVQGQISLYMVLQQAQRLGIFGPLCEPPEALVQTLQTMWADNGDVISTQYAGTAALKGDVTRNGERKLAGIMKDGYNSASR